MTAKPTKTATEIAAALAAPFDRVRMLPPSGRRPALPYLTADQVCQRLDEVLGLDGWQDRYDQVEGATVCTLRLKIGRAWITRQGIGAAREGGAGAPAKAAASDALKRAASKFGVGRYLSLAGANGTAPTAPAAARPASTPPLGRAPAQPTPAPTRPAPTQTPAQATGNGTLTGTIGAHANRLTPVECDALDALWTATKPDSQRFCQHFGIASPHLLPRARFAEAMAMLRRKEGAA